ncbi:type II secretion system F family protein [Candidatus Peregrinibacteria bacterium]|nr:type II secretion system F family protein [Candidatus Peregrinibacteria bacterium]
MPDQLISPSIHISKDEFRKVNVNEVGMGSPKGNLFERLNEWVVNISPLNIKEKVSFFRLMATMINAGVSLMKSLAIMEEQTKDHKMKRICERLIQYVEMGQTLSQGVAAFPDVFSTSEIGMIRSGEASGRLNHVLLSLADQVEKGAKLRGKIKGAMMYPMVIIIVIIGVFITITVMVIPKLKETFEASHAELPATTQLMININTLLQGSTLGIPNVIFILLGLGGLIALIIFWKKTDSGKYYWDSIMLQIPVFGMLRRKLVLASFSRSVSTLTDSGLSIVKTLRITAEVVGNEVYRRRIILLAEDVKQGITMGENLQGNSKMFPVMLVSMISVGEQTAQIADVTAKVAEFYEDEVDTMVKTLSSLMEPIIIVVIGSVVGFMVAAIMTPIMNMSEVVTKG